MTDWRSMRFGRSAASYHDATPVQRWMSGRLLELLPRDADKKSIVELGCGTGHLTRHLAERFPKANLLATDLSSAMLTEAAANWPDNLRRPRWMSLDARTPNEHGIHPDLVASNAVVQWFPDLEAHFRAVRHLSPHGTEYLLSGFSPDHFPELERILTSTEFGYPRGPGHDPSFAIAAAARAGWKAMVLHEETKVELYVSAADFLRHLKASGANRPPPDGKTLTRSKLQRLLDRLAEDASSPRGLGITWKPWFLLLQTT